MQTTSGQAIVQSALAAYVAWVNAVWAAGGSDFYVSTASGGDVLLELDWTVAGGLFGVNGVYATNLFNGETISGASLAELLGTSDDGNAAQDSNAANNGPTNSATPPPCQAKILNATNNHFGTNYTDANVSSTFNYSTGAPPGQGTLNLNISASTAGVTPGYSPVNWWTYVIGYGPTLHVVSGPGGNGGLDSQDTLQFGPNQATLHIDSGFPYNPIGLFFHWLLNMTKAGGYPQC